MKSNGMKTMPSRCATPDNVLFLSDSSFEENRNGPSHTTGEHPLLDNWINQQLIELETRFHKWATPASIMNNLIR